MSKKAEDNLVWIDLEMSGLNPQNDVILEVATIITNAQLNIIATGPNIAVRNDMDILDGMDEWNQKHHNASGLVRRVLKSSINITEAEKQTLDFVKKYTKATINPLCGNSIGQDKRFIEKYMPKLTEHLSYRVVDVTSVKELVKRWYPKFPQFKKEEKHLALDDIRESIAELQHYREKIFRTEPV